MAKKEELESQDPQYVEIPAAREAPKAPPPAASAQTGPFENKQRQQTEDKNKAAPSSAPKKQKTEDEEN